jgi:hypothetical protein
MNVQLNFNEFLNLPNSRIIIFWVAELTFALSSIIKQKCTQVTRKLRYMTTILRQHNWRNVYLFNKLKNLHLDNDTYIYIYIHTYIYERVKNETHLPNLPPNNLTRSEANLVSLHTTKIRDNVSIQQHLELPQSVTKCTCSEEEL